MGDSSNDCYLCGARNEPLDDFCVRCDGQLLRLSSDEPDEPAGSEASVIDDVRSIVGDEQSTKPKQPRWRKGSVEDQRLSDALGLEDNSIDEQLLDTVVTSIPRANPSAEMPMIGTRPAGTQAVLHTSENPNRRTYVLLGLLLLATVWLGYTTLTESSEPDNLAYTSAQSTSTTITTTTTAVPTREWTVAEVDGRFGSAFVRAELFACEQSADENGVPVVVLAATGIGSGIAVDQYNSVLQISDLPNATAARIVGRSGTSRIARIDRDPDTGAIVATSHQATSRHLRLSDETEGDRTFFLHFDPETNAVQTSTTPVDGLDQIVVTNLGDVQSIRVDDQVLDHGQLLTLDTQVELTDEPSSDDPVCAIAFSMLPTGDTDLSTEEDQTTITNGVEKSS